MEANLAYAGRRFRIEYAVLADGSMPASEFLEQQETRWRAKMLYLFQRLGDIGEIKNREQFKKVGGDFWEFKAFQVRVLSYFRQGGIVVLTHGIIKKQDIFSRAELQKAESIRAEYTKSLRQH